LTEWKTVPSYPKLEVSIEGVVRYKEELPRSPDGRAIKRYRHPWLLKGYSIIDFEYQNLPVHRLICEAFNGPCPPGYVCDHVDNDITNNHPDNLQWVTHGFNINKDRISESYKGTPNPKLTDLEVECIRWFLDGGTPQRMIAEMYNVSQSTISHIKTGILYHRTHERR